MVCLVEMDVPNLFKQPIRWFYFLISLFAASLFFYFLPQDPPVDGAELAKWYSVLPPLVAVGVALFFRNLVVALSAAFVTGSILTFGDVPLLIIPKALEYFIWNNLVDGFSLTIIAFLFFLVGMIHVAYRSGGIHGLVDKLTVFARGPRSTKLVTTLAGFVIFFDDYSNTVLVGSTMKTLSDKYRVSREKLAYLVDSTTAPIAGLAALSTWIAFEIFLFSGVATKLGLAEGGYAIFIKIIPYRFYCWGTLIFLFISSASNRDFGPMYKAERRAATTGKVLRDGARPLVAEKGDHLEPPEGQKRLWSLGVLPIVWVLIAIFGGLILVGRYRILAEGGGFSFVSLSDFRNAFGYATNPVYGETGSMGILALSALTGGILAIGLAVGRGVISFKTAGKAYLQAIPTLWMAVFILIMAWAMKEICTENGLGTDRYLISLMGDSLPLWVLPLATFLLSASVAFSTGTSFGTMGILIPVILPLAYNMGAYDGDGNLAFWLTAAAILDGAIFGDHCSPISDTTVLSSISTGCDHIDHVETQMVYALTVMVIVSVVGYLAISGGLPLWSFFVSFPLIAAAVFAVIGKNVVK